MKKRASIYYTCQTQTNEHIFNAQTNEQTCHTQTNEQTCNTPTNEQTHTHTNIARNEIPFPSIRADSSFGTSHVIPSVSSLACAVSIRSLLEKLPGPPWKLALVWYCAV